RRGRLTHHLALSTLVPSRPHRLEPLACDADQRGRAGPAGAAVRRTFWLAARSSPHAEIVSRGTYLMLAPWRIQARRRFRSACVIPVAFPIGMTFVVTATC